VASLIGSVHARARVCVDSVTRFLFPQRCAACARPIESPTVLCAACWAAIPPAGLELCARCLVRERDPVGCARHAGFRVRPGWVYDERAAEVISAFKYRSARTLVPALSVTLARAARGPTPPDLVTEVPLHPARLRERGYNQAALLAEATASLLAVPWLGGVLARTRATAPQAQLGPAARRANLEDAFRIVRPECLSGKRILLIDDVITTGATLAACLETLEAAGAKPRGATLAWAQ